MVEKLLLEIEQLVGSDYFEYEMEKRMEQIKETGAGIEIAEQLLGIMERHPLDDFGMPGAMVHFIESFDPEYESILAESVKRRPALHTLWMLNRCINGNTDKKDEYINLLIETANRTDVEKSIRNSAQDFVNYQKKQQNC